MTQPAECIDTAFDIIDAFIAAMQWSFNPATNCPPRGGGSTDVRFFAGDAAPPSAWDAHAEGAGCKQPFLWVRMVQRYRSRNFPEPAVVTDCDLDRVLEVELGAARCAVTDEQPTWQQWATEAEIMVDDSWRIEKALCRARELLNRDHFRVGTGTIIPAGPDGGVIQVSGNAFVQF